MVKKLILCLIVICSLSKADLLDYYLNKDNLTLEDCNNAMKYINIIELSIISDYRSKMNEINSLKRRANPIPTIKSIQEEMFDPNKRVNKIGLMNDISNLSDEVGNDFAINISSIKMYKDIINSKCRSN